MKIIFRSTLLLFLVSVSLLSFAQRNGEKRADFFVSKLTEKLALSADQQSKAKVIFVNHFEKIKALRVSLKTATEEQKKAALKEQWQKTDAELLATLTDAQKTKYAEAKKEMRKNLKGRKDGKGKKAPEGVSDALDDDAF